MSRRLSFITDEAPSLADRAVGEATAAFDPGVRTSTTIGLRSTPDSLVLVHAPGEKRKQDELALAYGLTYQGDRDLLLVLPTSAIECTLQRLSAIETPVRVFDHDLVEHIVPPRVQVSSELMRDRTLRVAQHDLREFVGVVEDLVADLPLRPSHREGYAAWQFEGRGILQARRGVKGLKLDGEWGPHDFAAKRQELEARIDARRGDPRNAENRYQEWLGTDAGLRALGVDRVLREVPCSRPGRRRTFMDLLGIRRDQIHVIETKLSEDAMLGLQGLDYWLWAQGGLEEIQAFLGMSKPPRVLLDFVVSEDCLRYLMPVAESFHTSIRWRVGVVEHTSIRWVPRTGSRWKTRLQTHLGPLRRRDPVLVERARPAFDALEKRHDHLHHARSSQAFALNLFGGLSEDDRLEVGRMLVEDLIEVEEPVFELEDDRDRLGEGERYRTQVDVAFRGIDQAGASWLILIEVKLSEADFNGCGGFKSARNRRREICRGVDGFGHADCHLARRRYAEHVSVAVGLGCGARTSTNQILRNAAVGAVLLAEVDHVVFALCAPNEHAVIWRRWRDSVARIEAPVRFGELPANEVMACVEGGGELLEHYGLD